MSDLFSIFRQKLIHQFMQIRRQLVFLSLPQPSREFFQNAARFLIIQGNTLQSCGGDYSSNSVAGDLNLYGYVFNDPMNLIDPFGLDCGCRKPFNSNVFDNINSPWNWSSADADFAGWYLDQIKGDPTMKDVYNELFHSLQNYAWQQETFPPPPPPQQQPSKPFPPSSFLIDQNGDVIPQKPPGLFQSIKDAFTAPITPQVREDLTGQAHEQGSATNIAQEIAISVVAQLLQERDRVLSPPKAAPPSRL